MDLRHIKDNILRNDTLTAARREKDATAYLLWHIKEVDRRMLYSDWKFTSLFDWCTKELGLCEGSAHLRITAARMLEDMPELTLKIEQGSLSLSNISQVNQFCRQNDITDVQEKREILEKIENQTKREAEKTLFGIKGNEKPARETLRRISSSKVSVTYQLSDETLEAIQEVKALLGKNVTSDELLKLMAGALKKKVEKEKFKQTEKSRAQSTNKISGTVVSSQIKPAKSVQQKPGAEVKRTIPNHVKREVYARDKKCTNCGTSHRLNFDHRMPFSMGGAHTAENIRLLCFHCNQKAWKRTSSG